MKYMTVSVIAGAVLLLGLAALAGAKGPRHSEVTISDDWPAAPPLPGGTIECPGGEIEWLDEVTPYCPATGQIIYRDIAWWSCFESADPRLTGVGYLTANGNWDSNYTGPVWGTWMIVPSGDCDPTALIAPTVFWEGTWQGHRTQYCDSSPCYWIGDLNLTGKGYGGNIDGIHFRGNDIVTTYTPMPVPWDVIPGFPVSGPEGLITAVLID